ncbi:MAG: hypothetical protein K2M17_02615 [Bacilli bacterium]|nr:hypothetical protein [Bacilli bacterium]
MNKKITIGIIIVLASITGVLLLLHKDEIKEPANPENPTSNKEKVDYKYLILENISTWGYNDGKFRKINPENLEEKDFLVYEDNHFIGVYNLQYGTDWNLFDKSNNFIDYTGSLLAHSSNFNIEVKTLANIELSNIELQEISSIIGFDIDNTDLSTIEIVTCDLDGNGTTDKIVSASNLDAEEEQQKYFNVVYGVINNKLEIIRKEEINTKDLYLAPVYSIKNILAIEQEPYASIIIQEGYFSEGGKTSNILYRYQNNKYTKTFED